MQRQSMIMTKSTCSTLRTIPYLRIQQSLGKTYNKHSQKSREGSITTKIMQKGKTRNVSKIDQSCNTPQNRILFRGFRIYSPLIYVTSKIAVSNRAGGLDSVLLDYQLLTYNDKAPQIRIQDISDTESQNLTPVLTLAVFSEQKVLDSTSLCKDS